VTWRYNGSPLLRSEGGAESEGILAESAKALAVVGSLTRDRPKLNLLVVGHTDGVGSFNCNL